MITSFSITFVVIVFIVIYFRLYLYLFPKNRLTILMYHQIDIKSDDDLTVSLENLEKQFEYLRRRKYHPKFFRDIDTRHNNSIIITFDDGYKNNYDYLPYLLEKFNLKATIFIPTKFIQEGYKDYEMMSFEEIRSLDKRCFEIALHSHSHKSFRDSTTNFIKADLQENMKILKDHQIEFSKVLAYPYGKYPKKKTEKEKLFLNLKNSGILFAVRIGNKINYFPTKNSYELQRIDIKGTDTLIKFKLKLIFGKLKLF
ncbi:polysaccharide deacetylase family protein [Chryseobacterium sp.]|uniref:polysaccharide deacetylase family protein n=1 Tax=Chryseobacterium sp. TaxID=1871047 RepID=UPI0025BDAD10|nr:polysaccharide deacetylase family protein [Chryseobacterium sp.]